MVSSKEIVTWLLEQAEEGAISWEELARECIAYMSYDDIADMAHTAWSVEDEIASSQDSGIKVLGFREEEETEEDADEEWLPEGIVLFAGVNGGPKDMKVYPPIKRK